MRRMLNTLYVTTQDSYLHRDGECVAVEHDGATRKFPLHMLEGLVLRDRVMCSPALLGLCAERGVSVSWIRESGRFLASVRGPVDGNVLLRRAQYRMADDGAATAALARAFVIGKVSNARTILLRAARDRPDGRLDAACARMADVLRRLEPDTSLAVVRGLEGEAAQAYFSAFPALIRDGDPAFRFSGRSRRPPRDAVNAMLSYLYVLLMHEARSALECCGLDPQVGFLHRDRPGRPGLALDLMEEFRSWLADRLVCTLINRGQVRAGDFRITESGAAEMNDDARATLIEQWQKRKQEEIMHPFLQEAIPAGMAFQVQARLLARRIRGDLDAYPPLAVR